MRCRKANVLAEVYTKTHYSGAAIVSDRRQSTVGINMETYAVSESAVPSDYNGGGIVAQQCGVSHWDRWNEPLDGGGGGNKRNVITVHDLITHVRDRRRAGGLRVARQ